MYQSKVHILTNQSLDWSLVEEKKECGGEEVNEGGMDSIDQCAMTCSRRSSMFIFGTNDFGNDRCFSDGCKCVCETAAKDEGTCDTVDHNGFRLYRFVTSSKYKCHRINGKK